MNDGQKSDCSEIRNAEYLENGRGKSASRAQLVLYIIRELLRDMSRLHPFDEINVNFGNTLSDFGPDSRVREHNTRSVSSRAMGFRKCPRLTRLVLQ